MIELDYRDARPIYTQIVDAFREQTISGILNPGDRLPSVRDLATQLTINPNTIQRAYRELEAQGWIASVPGKGSFIAGIPACTPEKREALLKEFDKLTVQLLAHGVPREELLARLTEGGSNHA